MKKFNNLLEKISFLNKTRILLSILIIGMASICFLTFISLFALKYDHEVLFKHRVEPIEKLENIRTLYQNSTFLTLQNLLAGEYTQQFTKSKIDQINKEIENQWQDYKDIKNNKIGGFASFASWWLTLFVPYRTLEIDNDTEKNIINSIEIHTQNFKNEINILLDEYSKKNMSVNLNMEAISSHLYKVTGLYANLIKLYISEAKKSKDISDRGFLQSITALIMLIFVVFVSSALTSYFILWNIRKLHNYLNKDVRKKTQQLEDLNSSLEQRILVEIENSRRKDNILFQQSKLASLGEMLQNIAHQWRQPLGAITMIIQSFETKSKNGKLTDKYISEKVENAQLLAQNMSDTIEDFRMFFNPNKSKKQFSLKDIINKSFNLTQYLLDKEMVTLHVKDFEDRQIFGFKNELTHVLLNIINNAKDALAKSDKDKKIWIMVKSTDDKIIIDIMDNAGGIKPEILGKIFEPYFTTKHQSMGTGIGLYMSKQIIEEHMNGKIYCQNIKHKMGADFYYDCAIFSVEIPIFTQKQQGEFNDRA